MSSNDGNSPLSGVQAAGETPNRQPEKEDTMKRAHAKHMIEQYYQQLTDGCGCTDCSNECCASCPKFRFSDTDRNKLAVQAIELFQSRAELCQQRTKKTRLPVQESQAEPQAEPAADGAAAIQPSTSASSLAASFLPTPTTAATASAVPKKCELLTFLTEARVKEIICKCREEGSWTALIRAVGAIFNNPDSLRQSFLREDAETITSVMGLKFPVQESQSEAGTEVNPNPQTGEEELKVLTLDLASLRRAVDALMAIEDHPFQSALNNALVMLASAMDMNLRYHNAYKMSPDYINIVLIVFEIPLIHTPEFIEDCLPVFCQACRHLPLRAQARLARIWSTFGESRLRDLLQVLQQLITVRVIKNEGQWNQSHHINDDEGIVGATRMMKTVYYASLFASERDDPSLGQDESSLASMELDDVFGLMQGAVGEDQRKEPFPEKVDPLASELGVRAVDLRKPIIPFEEFINEPLNENLDITTDYAYYRAVNDSKFSFVNHNFILTTASKHTSMYYDNRMRMLNERRTSLFQTLVYDAPPMHFLKVKVRRDHVVEDALLGLEVVAMENPADLKKQLFVEFEGEQGLDEGGVSKEFFQLIVEELFNPDIGMFTHREDTGLYWFNPISFENDAQFTLIGILLGLAIYNSCILNIQFPMVVYRKLMGKRGTFKDLPSVDPTIAASLEQLLSYEGDDLEDVFMHSFQIGYSDVFGSVLTHDLKEDGRDIPVTQANKQEFVELYSDFLLNKSIERQFKAFRRGFVMVTSESPLKLLFRPDEVETLVCGSRVLDFTELERATDYDGGFTASSPTILHFWEVVHNFSEEQKRKLLQFTTGTDRVPVGGLAKLKLMIARNGPDSDRLPTSHTCFNVLLLPDYSSKDKLQERLLKAINYAKGFGML